MMRKFNSFVFLLVMASGCLFLLWHLRYDDLEPVQQHSSWLDGSITHALDQRIAKTTSSHKRLDNTLNGILYATTGDPDPQVRQGCPGWLFLTEELVETPKGQEHIKARLALINIVQAELKTRHISLVSVPIPDKVIQVKNQLCGLPVSTQAQSRYRTWQSVSSNTGLSQVDLTHGWVSPGYWHTDTHWDREGADYAAKQIASAIQPLLSGDMMSMDLRISEQTKPRIGDLTSLASLDMNVPPFAPAVEQEKTTVLSVEHRGGLLDDVAPPGIVLVGSSYSINSGFIDYLQWHLKREVVQKSVQGSGFAGSLIDLVTVPAEQLNDIQLVIWEWPLRVLFQPLTDKEKHYLQQHGVQL